jgi:2-isopropylmalate synthase
MEERMGADIIIDAGLPGASPLDFSGVQTVVSNTQHAILNTLAHGTPTELAVAARALKGAEKRSRISTFHRPMELSSRYKNSESSIRKRLLKQARRAIKAACGLAPEVQYYLVYAGNRDPDFLAELAHEVTNAGATHVVIADSQSALTPSRAHKLTLGIHEAVVDGTTLAIHCHNQMGLALPNTLAAISAGATQVESCLLGVGDAGGNLAT